MYLTRTKIATKPFSSQHLLEKLFSKIACLSRINHDKRRVSHVQSDRQAK